MSKKKRANNIKNLIGNKADIITKDNSFYHIRKSRIYICGSDYYGKVYTISSNKYNKKNVHIIKEFYDNESNDNRLRFRIKNLHNAKKFRTIEHLPDGKERKIAVIESYDDSSEYICSIGNISSIKSDLQVPENDHSLRDLKVLKLILQMDNHKEESNNKKVA